MTTTRWAARAAVVGVAAVLLGGLAQPVVAEVLMVSPQSGSMQIYRMDDDGAHSQALTQGPRDNTNALWSPNGQRIAFVSSRTGTPQVMVMNADGSEQRAVSALGAYANLPVWSPDSRQLVFPVMRPDRHELVLADLETGVQRSLWTASTETSKIAWSPDGQQLLYGMTTANRGESDLHVLDLVSGARRLLVAGKGAVLSLPVWSPDGQWIAYSRAAGKDGINIHLTSRDGASTRQLTQGNLMSANPVWSPDGRWVAYESNAHTGERMDVFVQALAGGEPRNLSQHPHEDFEPAWAPDSQSLWFVSYRTGLSQIYRATLAGEVSLVSREASYQGHPMPRPEPPVRAARAP
ncbi:MAG: hypothetical protein RJA98_4107 [Pseudomonadota bacterium]|jgi:Tol biopolymer transport system component